MPLYSIVENPGLPSEDTVEDRLTIEQAQAYLRSWYRAGDLVEIRKEQLK